jgi:serine/threonine protein kinase
MTSASGHRDQDRLVARAGVLQALGDETASSTQSLLEALDARDVEIEARVDLLAALAERLDGLPDPQASLVVRAVVASSAGEAFPTPTRLHQLFVVHADRTRVEQAEAVADCLELVPPPQIEVQRRLSQRGSQKIVYDALWISSRAGSQRDIMLKRFLDSETEKRLLERELQPHPLSMEHENIIETHLLFNQNSEPFLVEKKLSHVLSDDWSARGAREAVNVLHDIAAALDFLTDEGLIHGDVKPDNIGYEDGRYILLDFGIARPITDMSDDMTATGSLRTRAPELLLGEAPHSPASDVWALGATVFNALAGRFPLIRRSERVPSIFEEEARHAFETQLKDRIANDWTKWVDEPLARVAPETLRRLLEQMLVRDPRVPGAPEARASSGEVVRRCRTELASLVRESGSSPILRRAEEVEQLLAHQPSPEALAVMPGRQATAYIVALRRLSSAQSLDPEQRDEVGNLADQISSRLGVEG